MAYRKPNDLDGFIQMMPKADMRVKALLAEDLVTFLSDNTKSIVCIDMGLLVDGLLPWLTGSHFKIAQKSLEAFTELIKRLGPDFNAYTVTVLPHVIDRLGDNRDTVREKAQLLLQNLMEYKVLPPQTILDKLANACFKHKNAKVREEFLQTIVNTLNEYGTSQLTVRNYIQAICTLLGDPTFTVRDAALQTLVEIYKHVGDRLRSDLRKMDEIPASKLAILENKFDLVKNEGLLVQSAVQTPHSSNNHDDTDSLGPRERPSKIVKRTISSALKTKLHLTEVGGACDAGAVTIEIFEASFEIVPQLTIFHPKDMDDIYKNILSIMNDKSADWEKRVDSLKKIRSLLLLNIHTQPQFALQIKELSLAFLDILKEELRSQVIREACITIAYMSKTLRNKLEQFCISILEQLINLIQNSAKVISSSSTIALKYIVKYTHVPKLIKIMTDTLQQSKSKDIRATLCEVMCLLFDEWQTKSIERYAPQLRDAIKRSISDADNEARKHSRRAYWAFRQHFPELSDQIYTKLDITTQRALERDRDSSTFSSGNQSNISTSRIQRSPSLIQKTSAGVRSVSALDAAAAQRAKSRAQYVGFTRKKLNSFVTANNTGSLPRPKPLTNNSSANFSQSHIAAPSSARSRSGVSQSQPGSRSTSPSSKLREYQQGYFRSHTGAIPKKTATTPRSLASSRETSPTRGVIKRNTYSSGLSRRTPERTHPPRSLGAARILQQSREAENALANAISPDDTDAADYTLGDYGRGLSSARIGRKLLLRDESDDSEASSVCSERSLDSSYARGNNSNCSLPGSRGRVDWGSSRALLDDIDAIIKYCASAHWSERKDGLIRLTQYLADGRNLTSQQLQEVLDMFRKLFLDTHTKVYSLFLDAVTELILAYANNLHDWLFILLTRLFNKLGTELLNSMHGKIWKTLKMVHEYFPTELQVKDVFRILSDTAQTPCTKTKIAILKFLTNLVTSYCKSTDFPVDDVCLSVDKTLTKILQLATDQKSAELRSQARICLIALYNCNTPQMTKVLANLTKGHQDTAKSIIQSHLRRNSTSGTNSPSLSPLSSTSPKPLQSPAIGPFSMQPLLSSSPRSRQSSVDHELFSELDVQHNIHKTSEEIRNCFGPESSMTHQYHYVSNANGYNNGHIHDQQDSCASSNSKTQSATTTESSTPENATMRLDNSLLEQNYKSFDNTTATSTLQHTSKSAVSYVFTSDGELALDNGLRESEIIKIACNLAPGMSTEHLQKSLSNLGTCIKNGSGELPNKHFRAIMKMLLNLLEGQTNEVTVAVLHVLGKILRNDKMKTNWIHFLELILLKIINCYQTNNETAREINAIMPKIAPSLPLNVTINIVNPVIATGLYPLNLCAVKLLMELADKQGSQFTEVHLDSVFPYLARLTDDLQSPVRKAAVFCIVKLYLVMGEEKVRPKLSVLNPSKVRLLNVYIEKQRISSGCCSTIKNITTLS